MISNARIETQVELVNALRARGVPCTQATVSRDVKEMKLTKLLSEDGRYYYAESANSEPPAIGKLLGAFSNGYLHSDYSGNIVVIKTVTGMAPVCALAIDAVNWPEVVGTLAGDDTIIVVTKSVTASRKLLRNFESQLLRNGAE
jgi:transcriptional regulator of arginine metabolism